MNQGLLAGAVILAAGAAAAAIAMKKSAGVAGLGKAERRRRKMQPFFRVKGAGGQVAEGYRSESMTIQDRLGLMQDMVAADVRDPEMRKLALQVTSGCPERDDACEMKAIYDFVKKRPIRYTGDIAAHKLWRGGPVESVDLYSSGKRTLEAGGGDCDDHAVLTSSLAILNGIPAKFRATSPYRWGKSNYTHVYAMLGYPKNGPSKWIAVDTTLPGNNHFGEEYPFSKNVDVIA